MKNNKVFFYTGFLLIIILLVIVQIVVNIIIDPDMETRIVHGKFNRYKFSHTAASSIFNYNKLKTTPSILVFGTSRSHRINSDLFEGTQLLNMHSIYGNPYAVKSFLYQLDEQQIKNIKEIYYLIDHMTFNGQSLYEPVSYSNFFSRALQIIKSTDIKKILRAYETVQKNRFIVDKYINETGSFIFTKELPLFDPNIRTHVDPQEIVMRRQKYTIDTYSALKDIDQFAKLHHIKIIYFTPPLSTTFISRMDYKLYIGQREEFLKNIDGYYDLTYMEGYSDDHQYFSDFGHTNLPGAKKYLEILKNEDQKYYMTKEKLEKYKVDIKKYFSN